MTRPKLVTLAGVFMLAILASCTTTPLDVGYRAVTGAPIQKQRNQRPEVIETAPQDHERKLKEYMDRGAWLVGSSEIRSTETPSHDEIRIFAIARQADVAILSKQPIGTSVSFQPIPLKAERIETRGNGAWGATTRTSLGYRERQAGVLLSRITLLRCLPTQPSQTLKQPTTTKVAVPPAQSPSKSTATQTASATPPAQSQSKPHSPAKIPESTVYETIKTTETTVELKPVVSGDR
jgi:hypothetical protein